MKGWIIYSENETEVVSERNEVNRFVQEAKEEGIELKVLRPEQIDLFVTSQNKKLLFRTLCFQEWGRERRILHLLS